MVNPIGIFDSGVGGLSVMRALRRQLPQANFIYLADTANFPFGEKADSEVRLIVGKGIERLAAQGCKNIILACNTASTTSLKYYQQKYPLLTIDGVTPMLAEAAKLSKTKTVAVFATFATLESDYFHQAERALSADIIVLAKASYEWVRAVESGDLAPPTLVADISTFLEHNADVIVLGCTHFAFLEPAVRAVVGPEVPILEPGPIIATRLKHKFADIGGSGKTTYLVTSAAHDFSQLASRLLDYAINANLESTS